MPGTADEFGESDVPPGTAVEFGESDVPFYYLGESYKPDQSSNKEEVENFLKQFENVQTENKAAEGVSSEQEDESVSKIIIDTRSTVKGDDGEDFESLEVDCSVDDSDIVRLLKRAAKHHYDACNEQIVDQDIYLKCSALLRSEYVCKNFYNVGGSISWNYPKSMIIPIAIKLNDPDSPDGNAIVRGTDMRMFIANFDEYCTLSEKVSYARCRSRFPVPVLLFRTKYICRSGTLANRKVAAFEAAMRSFKTESTEIRNRYTRLWTSFCSLVADFSKRFKETVSIAVYGVEEMKKLDAKILELLEVQDICDLMVENRKVHTGIHVSSSEKINMVTYGKFDCLKIPYPGCEFFQNYNAIKSSPEFENEMKKLKFDWQSGEVDSVLGFTEERPLLYDTVEWKSYKEWDIVTLTKYYLKLLLNILDKGEGSVLVHCISGWDRTPLFISMLRISLWADNLIHRQLDCNQMAYFTLGYDWYLFGHNLPSRLRQKEEIMHFLFKFLPEIASEEFSLIQDSEYKPQLLQHRRSSIEKLSKLVLGHYEENILIVEHAAEDPDSDFECL